MKRYVALLLVVCVIVGLVCQIAFAKDFSDMPSSHWAYQYIDKLSNDGVINGYEDGSFRPDKEVTRAEFFKLVACAMMTEEEARGLDLRFTVQQSNNWYDKYVHYVWIRSMQAYNYSGDDYITPITREEMAYTLYKACVTRNIPMEYDEDFVSGFDDEKIYQLAMEKLGYEYTEASGDAPAGFTRVKGEGSATPEEIQATMEEVRNSIQTKYYSDTSALSYDSNTCILCISKLGLIKGYEDGTFRPANSLTRAEVATVIYRFSNLLNGGAE